MVDTEVRDAVIKLEVQMEQMSGALATMAESMRTLADIKYDIKDVKSDIDTRYQRYLMDYHNVTAQMSKIEKDIHAIAEKQRALENQSTMNTWFRENASKLGWMLIASGIGFIVWLVERNLGK